MKKLLSILITIVIILDMKVMYQYHFVTTKNKDNGN